MDEAAQDQRQEQEEDAAHQAERVQPGQRSADHQPRCVRTRRVVREERWQHVEGYVRDEAEEDQRADPDTESQQRQSA